MLERDLFAFNPLMKSIIFLDNPIRLIYPNIFDNLENLANLSLSTENGRESWSRNANKSNRNDLRKKIDLVRKSCDEFVYREVEKVKRALEDAKKENKKLKLHATAGKFLIKFRIT